jgi:hypothetical protein
MNVLTEHAGAGIVTGDRFFNGQALPVDFQAQQVTASKWILTRLLLGFSFLCATSATGISTYVGKGCLVSVKFTIGI